MFEFSCKVFESQMTRLSEARHSHFRVMMSKLGRLAEDVSSQATAKRFADLQDLLAWEGRLHDIHHLIFHPVLQVCGLMMECPENLTSATPQLSILPPSMRLRMCRHLVSA